MKTEHALTRPQIEYPQPDETVLSLEYTFRIAAPAEAEGVDVSINQGPWLACRKDVGYWWFDWSEYAEGEHEVIARTRGKDGRWRMSQPHEFAVALMP